MNLLRVSGGLAKLNIDINTWLCSFEVRDTTYLVQRKSSQDEERG